MLPETRPSKVGKWTEPALRVLRERYLSRKDGEVTEAGGDVHCGGRGAVRAYRGGGA